MKKRIFIIIIILITIGILILIGIKFTNSNKTNINKYLNNESKIDMYAKSFMPDINDLPKYQDISYKYNKSSIILFETETIILVVNYDEETYEKEKEKLTEKYKFLNHKVISNFDKSKYSIPKYEFSINSYNFKVPDENENYEAIYPKSFGIVGISDEKKSIAYLYFYDFDLDYISGDKDSSMANFIKMNFKYDF